MLKRLNLWYGNEIMGELSHEKINTPVNGFANTSEIITFKYTPAWLKNSHSFALSPHFPLDNKTFYGDVVWNFFENIIPEGESIYAINRYLQNRRMDLFGFLSHFGSDVPCAFQILPDTDEPKYTGEVQKFSFEELEKYNGPLLLFSKRKSLSLAGGQNKMGAVIKNGEFYIPLDSAPTTHIIKAYNEEDHPHCALNEFLMTKLAQKLGFKVPDVDYYKKYIIIKRYDRENNQRLHQIDLCQYFNRPSEEKYEEFKGYPTEERGLTINHYFEALSQFENGSDELVKWISFNFLIGNTDNHGKNISLLYKNDKWDIAPFYDFVSTTIYNYFEIPYNINGETNIAVIKGDDFLKMAEDNNYDPNKFVCIFNKIKEQLLDSFEEVLKENSIKHDDFIKTLITEFKEISDGIELTPLSSSPTSC